MYQSDDPFYESRQLAAVLKHGILEHYGRMFVRIVGKQRPHRVVVIDGFAGQPRYRDGMRMSPQILADLRDELAPARDLDYMLVESDARAAAANKEVFGDRARHGTFDEHLDAALTYAGTSPLLLYVDPYGRPPAMNALTRVFNKRPHSITELLMHFSRAALRNARNNHAGLEAAMGGGWLADYAEDADDWHPRAVERYCQEVSSRVPRLRAHPVEVRSRWDGPIKYWLVLFTRNEAGTAAFFDALPAAFQAFYDEDQESQRALREEQGRPTLFDDLDPEPISVKAADRYRDRIRTEVTRNLSDLLAPGQTIKIADHAEELYRGVKGYARSSDIRSAAKQLGYEVSGSTVWKTTITRPQ